MVIEDIKHPLVSDFLTRISGSGVTYLNTDASSRINDFINYLSSLTSDNGDDFAFYPLRVGQNIGVGNQVYGVGEMASGTNIIFPKNINWTESGVWLNSKNNCGIINFSGKLKDEKFQFRRNETSVFYFFKHNRPKYETSLYREGQICPYFWFDDSNSNFGVYAPEFSTSDFRTTGTTYLYDEIFGGDKKGYQMDFASDSATKYNIFNSNTGKPILGTGTAPYIPPAVSFYEIDNNENKFVCLNAIIKNEQYSLRSFFGRDYRILTGQFPKPYESVEMVDPSTSEVYIDNFFPRRMVIGAGVLNASTSEYDIDGIDHLCAGVLILRGDYSNEAKGIAENMAEAIGIKHRAPKLLSTITSFGNTIKDQLTSSGCIHSINYHSYVTPIDYKTYNDYTDNIGFFASIYSGAYINYGKWTYKLVNSVTGELRQPLKVDEIDSTFNVNNVSNFQAIIEAILPAYGAYYNQGVVGFMSGYGTNFNGQFLFTRFTEQSSSGASGFYLKDVSGRSTGQVLFPPTRNLYSDPITGYISGIMYNNDNFVEFGSGLELYSSGYLLDDGSRYAYPQASIMQEKIIGYISGFLKENGMFSGFDNNYLDCSSGYYYSGERYEFLPQKITGNTYVTGFLLGLKSGNYFSGFYQNSQIENNYSGILTDNDYSDPNELDPIVYKNFPTGSSFIGFSGMPSMDERLGFDYDGFFNSGLPGYEYEIVPFYNNSGFITLGPGAFPNTEMVLCTGLIGTRNTLNFFGTFSDFFNIDIPNTDFGYSYTGFFAESSGFSGEAGFGPGVYTGFIGHINKHEYTNLTGFNDENQFPIGGSFSGFSYPLGSAFSGTNGATGEGIKTGIIGAKYALLESGQYSGFHNIGYFTNPFLDEINIDFTFPHGSGFSGLNFANSGYGVMSGLLTTGKSPLIFGDPLYFMPYIVSIFNNPIIISGFVGSDLLTGVPEISGIIHFSGVISSYAINSGFMVTGDILVTGLMPEIHNITYFSMSGSDIIMSGFDTSAIDYISRVEAYEGQKLESGVRIEINKFISGLKTDGVWNSIVDCCLMAGPRTVSGIFIPLKGYSGLSYNFLSGDYNRASGLKGDASSKYIDTNKLLNAQSTGNQHLAVYVTQTGSPSINQYYMGAGIQNKTGSSALYASGAGALFQKARASGLIDYQNYGPSTGLMAVSRYNTGVWVARNSNISETAFVYIDNGAQPSNVYVFANNNTGEGTGVPEGYSDARIAIYSIGTNINILRNYENRIATYLSGIKQWV